jgi:hypothetical protein
MRVAQWEGSCRTEFRKVHPLKGMKAKAVVRL